MSDEPPLTITPQFLNQVADLAELVGRLAINPGASGSPKLRRENRIRTIHSSLAIENNTLTLAQVSDILDGKRGLGLPREIQEVKNAFAAYEKLEEWDPTNISDLLFAHGIMMKTLTKDAGQIRGEGVGIYRGSQLVHRAPPADRVEHLARQLFEWLEATPLHPLIAASVIHYELQFIHPFSDGNGRTGRLWQTSILSRWRPQLAFLPVETVIRNQQADYYAALGKSDKAADSGPFVEFMLPALAMAVRELDTDQVGDQVSDQVKALLKAFKKKPEWSAEDLMKFLKLKHRPTFRKNYLSPALVSGLIEMTEPHSPRSPTQRYRRVMNDPRF